MIFVIFGTDHYRLTEKLKELKDSFTQKRDQAGLNLVNLAGESLLPAAFEQETLTTPFLGEKKMIVIKNSINNKKIGKEIVEFLTSNLQRIDNALCFVDFIDPEKNKVNKQNKLTLTGDLAKYLVQQEYVWEFNLLNKKDLADWIRNYTKQKSITIAAPAIEELIIRAGNDLFQITSELSKLKALKAGTEISAADIKNSVNYKFADNIFNLVDAIGSQDRPMALKLMTRQLNFGSHPLMILSMIARQFKIILKAKSPGASALKLKIHPFVFSKAKTQADRFSQKELININNQILDIEQQLKTGEKNPELLLDLFISKNS